MVHAQLVLLSLRLDLLHRKVSLHQYTKAVGTTPALIRDSAFHGSVTNGAIFDRSMPRYALSELEGSRSYLYLLTPLSDFPWALKHLLTLLQ